MNVESGGFLMYLKKVVSILVVVIIMFSMISVHAADTNLQLYFEPKIMNDITGDLEVGVNIKNYDIATHISYGDIYYIGFSFIYDTEAFDIITDDVSLGITVNENTLIKSTDAVKSKVDKQKGRVDFEFNVSEISEDLIGIDGTLFNFTLKSTNVSKFWNSFDTYPLRFVEGSISVKTYDYLVGQKYVLENVIGYDCDVASYNGVPTLKTKPVNKTVEFNADSKAVIVDGEQKEMDAVPFDKDGVLMVPVRYLAENIGMEVEWNGDEMIACAYASYITLKVSLKDNKTYVNSALLKLETMPEEINGRIYVPVNIISAIYPYSTCTVEGNKVVIYVP